MRTARFVLSVALVGCTSDGDSDEAASSTTSGETSGGTLTQGDDLDGSSEVADAEVSSTAPHAETSTSEDGTTALVTTETGADESSSGTSTGGEPACTGGLPAMWIDGTDCTEPEIMVHAYDEDTYVLRQSLCTSFEGPFMFLLFGEDRVLLEDTGDGGIDIADTVYGIIDEWLADRGRASIELVVVNSHAHGDHVAGNPMFMGMPDTTVVTPSVAGLTDYFGIGDWPNEIVEFDLGGRTVDVIPIPGHHASHIALFDHGEGLLFTGDTLYPGRLYISDPTEYAESIHRLVDNVPESDVCHVLGTHVEMTQTPGEDFPFGADAHPNEHVLELSWSHVLELRDAVDAPTYPVYEVHDDFIIFP